MFRFLTSREAANVTLRRDFVSTNPVELRLEDFESVLKSYQEECRHTILNYVEDACLYLPPSRQPLLWR